METPRENFGATAIGEKIFIAGGFNNHGRLISCAEVYDSTSNEWSPLPDMREKRWGCSVVSVNGKINVIGGYDSGIIHASGEMFDPATNE